MLHSRKCGHSRKPECENICQGRVNSDHATVICNMYTVTSDISRIVNSCTCKKLGHIKIVF